MAANGYVTGSNGFDLSAADRHLERQSAQGLRRRESRDSGKQATDYGVIWFSANTEVDKVNRVVTLTNFDITKQSFPTLPNNGAAYASALTGELPWNQTVPLDLLQSDLAISANAGAQKTYTVQNNPPRIIYSPTPAVLALIDGKPVLGPEQDHLQKVINTRALIVYDTSKYTYYLALMDGWWTLPPLKAHIPSRNMIPARRWKRSGRRPKPAIPTNRWAILNSRYRRRGEKTKCRRCM